MLSLLRFGARIAAIGFDAFLEAFAPLDTPDMPVEPVLTGDEIVGLRQLLDERFPTQFSVAPKAAAECPGPVVPPAGSGHQNLGAEVEDLAEFLFRQVRPNHRWPMADSCYHDDFTSRAQELLDAGYRLTSPRK